MGIDVEERADSWHLHVGAGENWHHLVQFTEKGDAASKILAENPGLLPDRHPFKTSVPTASN